MIIIAIIMIIIITIIIVCVCIGRLIVQLSDAREETKRHVTLVEQLHRIESGLQSRVEAEKEALVHDKSVLQSSFEALRKQLDERNLMDEQRSKVTEDELRLLRNRLEQKTAEVSSLSEQLGRDQVLTQASQDRCNLLEKQLNITQDRIAQMQGTQIIDSSIANDITVKELALEKALSEIEALKQQLTSSEVHADQFRKISVANETALKEMRSRAEAMQTAQVAELLRMRNELETALQEVIEQRASSQRWLQDSEQAREELYTFRSESAEIVRQLEETLALSRQEVLQMNEQSLAVTTEITKYQEAAKIAHQNYERELQMHAQAERDLSDMRKQLEDMLSSLRKEQQRSAELSSECIRKELLLQDEKSRSAQESQQIREHMSGLQGTNDLLHAQVQSYGAQIEKLQTQRLHSSLASTTGSSSSSNSSSSSSTIAMTIVSDTAVEETKSQLPIDGVDGSRSSVLAVAADMMISQNTQPLLPPANKADDVDELVELRKTSVELREVLRFMKREKDMLTAKLSVSEMEAGRLASELQSLRRSLDEVKVELKRELDKR